MSPKGVEIQSEIWRIGVYEPNIDPGGYFAFFEVPATDQMTAEQAALERAKKTFPPDAYGLEVFEAVRILP